VRKRVSVIIPTFNRCALLRRAIGSVIGQTHSDLEILIVDDGSTDDTANMLRRDYGNDIRIKVIWQENQGVCRARNRALDAAEGDFIAFLDSDDIWLPWKLEVQVACLTTRPEAGMVWTDMTAVGPDNSIVHHRYLRQMYSNYKWFPHNLLFEGTETLDHIMPRVPDGLTGTSVHWGRIARAMIIGNLVHTSTVLMTRARLDRTGRFDEALAPAGEDHDFHLRACEAGPVGLIDVPSTFYQIGLADRLTRHREIMARNYLTTMAAGLNRASRENRPSSPMLRKARGAGHAWLADALLEHNKIAEARAHLIHSLINEPVRPRQLAELLLAILPASLYQPARRTLATLRRSLAQSADVAKTD
jgi:GT2 family glycosyltransferase